ncbi:MAG: ribose 5-phosphate isomerase A [Bacteroidota bacterium]|nr:ribose 5-phosphate isomerase A [Bacteroidota bacterium]
MELKQQAAQKAATLVESNTIVGLGAGASIAYLVECLEKSIHDGLVVQFVTSCISTRQLLQNKMLRVNATASFSEIDLYFDGCDQLDDKLNALKSGGGIHTHEKLLAAMSRQFVLIGDEAKLVKTFDVKFPLVLEILPDAVKYVPLKIKQLFVTTRISMRMSDQKDAPLTTEYGNYLVDIYFKSWPELSAVNAILKSISGVVETSLFYGMAHRAIIAGERGVEILEQ